MGKLWLQQREKLGFMQGEEVSSVEIEGIELALKRRYHLNIRLVCVSPDDVVPIEIPFRHKLISWDIKETDSARSFVSGTSVPDYDGRIFISFVSKFDPDSFKLIIRENSFEKNIVLRDGPYTIHFPMESCKSK